MNLKKLLLLLTALVIYINYQNYISKDTSKLYQQVLMLQDKITTQQALFAAQTDPKNLGVTLQKYFFDGATQSYSQAMGAMQEQITQSAKDICQEPNINWAQAPQESAKFEKLRINVALRCDATMFNKFITNLKAKEKIYTIENLKISKDGRKNHLVISMQIVGYRINR